MQNRRKRTHGDPKADLEAMTDLEMRAEDWPEKQILGEVSASEFDEWITTAVAKLEASLQPFALLMLQGVTQEEIAKSLECSRRTVSRKLELIKEFLRKYLEEEGRE